MTAVPLWPMPISGPTDEIRISMTTRRSAATAPILPPSAYAGTGVMNFDPVYGWFYRDPNDKAPAWTGVEYFFDFITRQTPSPGPFGISTTLSELEPGDFVQFRFNKDVFGHTPVVVEIGRPATLQNTLIAAHSYDADWRPLSTYYFQEIRFLHIQGAYREIRGEEVLPSM